MIWLGVRRAALVRVLLMMASPAAALEASEPAIKAAFLSNFGFYVEWPQTAFAASDSPINLCIVGHDPFGALLDDSAKGQKIGNRTIAVHRISAISRNSDCHIAYLPNDADPHTTQALAALRGSDILTVTDATAADSDVGIINFVVKDNRVRFDIDDAAAASGGLVISSRLMKLALEVKPRQ
jgi:hypothetical protein